MRIFIEMLKGVAIGIANIIPGVSGGTIAVITGIYTKIINALSLFIKHPIAAIKSVWIYIVGIIIGLIVAVFAISYLYDNAPLATSFLFIGFILGSLPYLTKDLIKSKISWQELLLFLIMFLLVAILPFFRTNNINFLTLNTGNLLLMFFLGMIAIIAMIIPGISGSMVLMILGYYNLLLTMVKNIFATNHLAFITAFGFGAIVGLLGIARLIKFLLSYRPRLSQSAILGLVVASPIPILSYVSFTQTSLPSLIMGIFALVAGFYFSYKLSTRT